jgi:xanthine dehydrogenase accessory factor
LIDFHKESLAELAAGRPVLLATVVSRRGSAPRAVGARLLLKYDGTLLGTVGGGLLEAEVLEEGRRLLASGQARLHHVDMMGQGAEAAGMICGGMVDVYLERLEPGDSGLESLLGDLVRTAEEDRPGVVALSLDLDRPYGRRMLLTPAGAEGGSDWPPELEKVRQRLASGRNLRPCQEEGYYLEPLQTPPTAYIFGGGHVSAQIAPLASLVDFRVVVVDDRAEFADPARFPSAQEVLQDNFEGVVERLKVGRSGYAVIVTRGHRWDGQVLAQLLATPAAYIGMIGSRRKRDAIYDWILEKGFTEKDLERVYCPIGLDIEAETPEEIGVAIVAELIKARAQAGQSGAEKDWAV